MDRFAYFMVRIRRSPDAPPDDSLSGLVEQLATGEKQSFASGEELIRIVGSWPDAQRKISRELRAGNEPGNE